MVTAITRSAREENEPRARLARRRPARSQRYGRSRVGSFVCLALAVGLVVVVLLVPFVLTVYRSMFSDSLHSSFVGLGNYQQIFTDPILLKSLVNTLFWVVGSLMLPVCLALGIAVMTNGLRWGAVARLAIVLPCALSGTAVAVVGSFMLETDGAVNQALAALGLGALRHGWLLDWPENTISAILVSTWQSTGFAVVLFMVGLQGIPTETLEAAAIDGADGLRMFFFVILPQLRPVTAVVVGITLANALRAFDVTWVLTGGGPARTSETLAIAMYRETFLLMRPGVGAALAVLLTFIVVGSSWAYLRNQDGASR